MPTVDFCIDVDDVDNVNVDVGVDVDNDDGCLIDDGIIVNAEKQSRTARVALLTHSLPLSLCCPLSPLSPLSLLFPPPLSISNATLLHPAFQSIALPLLSLCSVLLCLLYLSKFPH